MRELLLKKVYGKVAKIAESQVEMNENTYSPFGMHMKYL